MPNKNIPAALASLALLGASLQASAEDLTYDSLGTGEEIREEILADNTNPTPDQTNPNGNQNTPQQNNQKNKRKPNQNGNGKQNGTQNGGKQSTEQKCGASPACGDSK